ncbi:MAG: MEDS domain-containing protein [Nitrososphaerota archaeon]
MHLLISSQNNDMLSLFDAYFNFQGINHTLVDDDTKCLDEIKGRTKKFDIIILDVGLYNFNRLEVTKTILELIPDQKIIITTADHGEGLKRKVTSIGIDPDNILLKPFKLTALLSAVKQDESRTNGIGLKDHIIAGYSSVNEMIVEAVQFLKHGIKNNECVMFIGGNKPVIDDLKDIFNSRNIDVDGLLSDNSLILIESKEWYFPDGKVDKRRIKDQWLELVNKCINKGKAGLRSFCMMDSFFEHNLIEELVDYENSLSPSFDFRFLPICAYLQRDLDKLSHGQKETLIASHNHVWTQEL